MRLLYTFLFGLSFLISTLQGQNGLASYHTAPLYAHLYEINNHWFHQVNPVSYLEDIQFSSDAARIQKHLQLVEGILRQRPIDHLCSKQQENRRLALDALRDYWQKGAFPINKKHQERIPIFVDEQGTACAVGQLLLATQQTEIVHQIQAENNNATLEELLAYEALPDWALTYGFIAEELAWIQPAYAVTIIYSFTDW